MSEPVAASPPLVTPEVVAELERQGRPRTNTAQGWLMLALTMGLFVVGAQAFWSFPWVTLGLIVGVLLFHELGHLAAMLAFGYQDVRMFFIPFFGAAVAGRKHDASGTQRAVVALAGPIPGILLAFALVYSMRITGFRHAEVEQLVMLLLLVNVSNLLPIEPLDGGRFVSTVLLSRWPVLERGIRLLGAGTFAVLAWQLDSFLLGMLALWVFVTTPIRVRLGRAARRLATVVPPEITASAAIPVVLREPIARVAAAEVLQLSGPIAPKTLASWMSSLWVRMHERPPGSVATALLVTVYLIFTAGLALGAWFLWSGQEQAIAGQTHLTTDLAEVTLPGQWRVYEEGTSVDGNPYVAVERVTGGLSLSIERLGEGAVDSATLAEHAASYEQNLTEMIREDDVDGAAMLLRGQPVGGVGAMRVYFLEREGQVWEVNYWTADALVPAETLDEAAREALAGIVFR